MHSIGVTNPLEQPPGLFIEKGAGACCPSELGCSLLKQPSFQNVLEGPRFENSKISIYTPNLISSPPFFVIYEKVTEAYRTWFSSFFFFLLTHIKWNILIYGYGNSTEAPEAIFQQNEGGACHPARPSCLARKKEKVQNPLPRFENCYLHS